jgi:hypothetical protein
MKLLIVLGLLFSMNANSWTINNSTRAGFPISTIKIQIGSDTCSNASFTPETLEAIVKEAIDQFWNKIPTSALKLETSGNSGLSLVADDLTAAAAKADANSIMIGCSQDATLFSSNSILGLGGIGCSGGVCRSAVLMNDTPGSNLGSIDHATVVTALAHEIGHAVGLGHSSIQGSIMYYSLTAKTQKNLHQDDIDGISYLYPNAKSLSGLGGACGTIETKPKNKMNFLFSFIFGISLMMLFAQKKSLNIKDQRPVSNL